MQKGPVTGALFSSNCSTDFCHIRGLWSFLALNNFEFYLIALGERFESGSTDRAEVHENIGASLARYETKPLGVVEPFYRTRNACHLAIPLSAGQSGAVTVRAAVRKAPCPAGLLPVKRSQSGVCGGGQVLCNRPYFYAAPAVASRGCREAGELAWDHVRSIRSTKGS